MLVIIMGVSGCGKTTVGRLLSQKLTLNYYDADDFHPQSNIDKMKKGQALNDQDRQPWLFNLAEALGEWEKYKGAVLSCSALKESYRQILTSNIHNIHWVYLEGTFDIIKTRMENRLGHFMKSSLLQSQFDTLEVPNYGQHISIKNKPTDIINTILSKINNNG